jgi:UDP-N-acetylmuramate dehydrogenase
MEKPSMAIDFHMPIQDKERLTALFGKGLKEREPLARYTSARLGGPADYLVVAENADELAHLIKVAWQADLKAFILGGGSNVLVSDAGVRGLVIVNRARAVQFRETEKAGTQETQGESVIVRAESGANLGIVARQCCLRGLAGMEWAATVPGTVGGAVFGNAGAHGGEIAGSLRMAEILQPDGTVRPWSRDELGFSYRTSALKRQKASDRENIVLAAEFALTPGQPIELQAKVEAFTAQRKRTQPPGASLGSMFKNPPGDYAGRLIEAAGMKGKRLGNVEISNLHANFFVNLGKARASDVLALIHMAHETVKAKFGVDLELEVELVGEWGGQC